jgi:hypothetical protein
MWPQIVLILLFFITVFHALLNHGSEQAARPTKVYAKIGGALIYIAILWAGGYFEVFYWPQFITLAAVVLHQSMRIHEEATGNPKRVNAFTIIPSAMFWSAILYAGGFYDALLNK